MILSKPSLSLASASTILLLAIGCGNRPTYPKAHLAASVQQIFDQEHISASVRLIDHTLAVQAAFPDTLLQADNQITVGPAFNEAARQILTVVHRVLLSTDAEIRFYVILLSDPKTPGAYLTMVRYVEDLRRANANVIADAEFGSRTLFEVTYVEPQKAPLTLEQYVPREIHLDEFLSWQLAKRIQRALAEELESSGVATVGRCAGEFQNGEFAFTLNVTPTAGTTLDEAELLKVFHTSTNIIAKVLASYRFTSFNAIRLIHPATGRNLLLPKGRLEIFR